MYRNRGIGQCACEQPFRWEDLIVYAFQMNSWVCVWLVIVEPQWSRRPELIWLHLITFEVNTVASLCFWFREPQWWTHKQNWRTAWNDPKGQTDRQTDRDKADRLGHRALRSADELLRVGGKSTERGIGQCSVPRNCLFRSKRVNDYRKSNSSEAEFIALSVCV